MSKFNIHNHDEHMSLVELLLRRQAELNGLLEITQAINKNASVPQLVEMLNLILKTTLKIGKFKFFIKNDHNFSCISAFGTGQSSAVEDHEICKKLANLDVPTPLSGYDDPLINQYEYFIPVFHKEQALACILIGDMQVEQNLITNRIDYIQTLANVIVVAFENKKLFKERIQKERLQKEVELASQVQHMFIPQKLPENAEMDVAAIYLPHESIGGDFFDFIELNENEILWCIADVSGKGISAALLMANFQASLRALVTQNISLEELIHRLNQITFKNTKGDRFITLFIARYHKKKRNLKYINAGHNATLLIRENQIIPLQKGTTMIGAFDELPFIKEENLFLQPSDIIFNYTDGLIEHDGEEGLCLSEDSLTDFLLTHSKLPLKEINEKLIEYASKARKNILAADDITLLSLKFF